MKKFLLRVMMGILVVFCLLSSVGCGGKSAVKAANLSIAKLKTSLVEKGYDVDVYTETDVGGGKAILYADCEAGDILVIEFKSTAIAEKYYEYSKAEYESEIEFCKKENAYYNEVLKSCKDELLSEDIAEYEDEIKENNTEIKENEEELKYMGQTKNYFWMATAYTIQDIQ